MNKQIFFTGFMLFALFFGAGNLIYPPLIGMEAGTSYWFAILGFILTGVGLPILAVTAIAVISPKAVNLGDKLHPMFGLIFTSIIYLAIGPFFGIPRAASVAFEMGVAPVFDQVLQPNLLLLCFTFIFFGFVFWQSLHPSKLVERIGQWLTPVLLLAITALCIGGFILLDADVKAPSSDFQKNAFFIGFREGYLTMDAIAALAFGIIIVTSFKQQGITSHKTMIASTLKAGAVSGIGLAIVYGSLGWIGTKMTTVGSFKNGGEILSESSSIIFGTYGKLLLGLIVLLACLTTSIGLTVACGQFFSKKTTLSYKAIISIVTVVSFLLSNLGLNQIIDISVPVLVTIYPVTIILIVLAIFNQSTAVNRYTVLFTAIFSMYDGLVAFGLEMEKIEGILAYMPLHALGLGWLMPAVIGVIIGKTIDSTKTGW